MPHDCPAARGIVSSYARLRSRAACRVIRRAPPPGFIGEQISNGTVFGPGPVVVFVGEWAVGRGQSAVGRGAWEPLILPMA